MTITAAQVANKDRVAASFYWTANLRPSLAASGLPEEALKFMHNDYVTSVQANPEAMSAIRKWYFVQ